MEGLKDFAFSTHGMADCVSVRVVHVERVTVAAAASVGLVSPRRTPRSRHTSRVRNGSDSPPDREPTIGTEASENASCGRTDTLGSWRSIAPYVLPDRGVTLRNGVSTIPYRARDGSPVRERHITSGGAWWGPGDGICLFGLDRVPGSLWQSRSVAYLCEGESDALALIEHLWDDVAAFVFAVPDASTWQPAWAGHLAGFSRVYVLGDGDPAGERLNCAVCRDLRNARAVWLPEKTDVRELLQQRSFGTLDQLLDETDRLFVLDQTLAQATTPADWARLVAERLR